MSFRIMLAGGGSGGHVYPLVAIAEELKLQAQKTGKDIAVRFIGDGDLMASTAREIGVPFSRVWAPKWRRYFSILNFIDIFKIPVGIIQAFLHVWLFMPDVMLVKGGYAAFFPALAAKIMAVPLVVHESDSVPGKVNLWWGKMARRVFVSFEHAKEYFRSDRTEVVGNPIRSIIEVSIGKQEALASFGFDASKPTVFINGGSQGAKAINTVIVTGIVELVKKFFIIHQCGAENVASIGKEIEGIIKEETQTFGMDIQRSYKAIGHLTSQEMAQAYQAADVVVSRAGSALFEMAALGKPSIIIPLPDSAHDHQVKNAEEFERYGGILIEQDNLNQHILMNEIFAAYENRDILGKKIKEFAKPDAAAIIAKELLQALS